MNPDVRATWEKNWPYMLIAFALAVVLWLSVSAEGATQQEIPVRLIVQNLDTRYVMTSRPPDRVNVLFRGPGRDLFQFAVFAQPRLLYRVEAVRSRVQEVELTADMVALPEGAKVTPTDVRNGRLVLRFEPALERSVRVVPRVEVIPAPGFALSGPIAVHPARVEIRGAESAVHAIDTLWTVPLRLEGLADTAVREIEIERPDVESPLELATERVRVEVAVEPAIEVVFEDVPVRLVGAAVEGLAAAPARVSVHVRGPQSRVARIGADQVDARVRLNDGEARAGWHVVEVIVPDRFVEAAASDSVRVFVRGS